VDFMDTGKKFENEIRQSLKKVKCFWFRIQDTNDVSRFVDRAIAEKQPADFMAVYKGTPILIECKTTRRKISFPLYYGKSASIPRHQIDYALENEKNGGRSFFLLRKDEARKKRVWAVTPQGVDKMYKKATKKSIKWEDIENSKESVELERIPNPVRWDLRKLWEQVL
tara:strand:+ start:1363 stop:1866 length:504 start_codon:yes stop_codon:yes gene_type:complete